MPEDFAAAWIASAADFSSTCSASIQASRSSYKPPIRYVMATSSPYTSSSLRTTGSMHQLHQHHGSAKRITSIGAAGGISALGFIRSGGLQSCAMVIPRRTRPFVGASEAAARTAAARPAAAKATPGTGTPELGPAHRMGFRGASSARRGPAIPRRDLGVPVHVQGPRGEEDERGDEEHEERGEVGGGPRDLPGRGARIVLGPDVIADCDHRALNPSEVVPGGKVGGKDARSDGPHQRIRHDRRPPRPHL